MEPTGELSRLQQLAEAATPLVLGLQTLVFVVWAFLMYRNLFMLRRRAVDQTGRTFPGPVTTARGFADFVRRPEFRRDRNLLGLVTLALFVLIGLNVVLVRLLA